MAFVALVVLPFSFGGRRLAVRAESKEEAAAAGPANARTTSEFPYAVDFEQGATKFEKGDDITILEVRGTAETFTPGHIYWIRGKYTLASHKKAALAAYTTAMDAENGTSQSFQAQHIDANEGEGTFTLFLPMSYRGWPHVSFYAEGGSFGGNYFGTGDSVLKRCWASKDANKTIVNVDLDGAPPSANQVDADLDSDGDGLPDYQERHKYQTDPHRANTAGEGKPDGDPLQRREFTYSVRAVMRLMPPYNLAAMNDDYQDARLLSQTDDFAEVEIVCYPLNTNGDLETEREGKRGDARMAEYLEPGVTTNWNEAMRGDLLEALKKDGIDPGMLTDRQLVEQASRWLFARSTHRTMFCTHFVHFPAGRPAVLPGLETAFQAEKGDPAWSVDEQFAHELLGKEMFDRKTHGSCTSAATCQATVLRALGIPTRIIVAAPVIDASDPNQLAMARKNLSHNAVRSAVEYAALSMKNSYSNHTFLEVFVNGRWRRLNYSKLGQSILDSNYLGLMVHVHTFRDLSEANLAATWGKRYALGERDPQFRHSNPYRTVSFDEHFGRHAKIANPPAPPEHRKLTISRIYWSDAADAPELIRKSKNRLPPGAGRLFFHTDEWFDDAGDYLQYKLFLSRADDNFVLRAKDQPDVKCQISSYITQSSNQVREFEIMISADQFDKMPKGVTFTLTPLNAKQSYRWRVLDGLTIERPADE